VATQVKQLQIRKTMKYFADNHNSLKTHHVVEKERTLRRMPGARISP